jgi:hypothetical protein
MPENYTKQLEFSMYNSEIKKYSLDIFLLGLLYMLIFTSLMYFVFPIEIREFASLSALISGAMGSALFYGVYSGLFTGIVGGFWVNRLNLESPINIGLFTGLFSAIIGSCFFPIFGALVRIYYFGINPAEFGLEISFLINYSLIGIIPGIFVGIISGILGGMLVDDFV